MRLTARDLYEMGIVERVFPEPAHYTVQNLRGGDRPYGTGDRGDFWRRPGSVSRRKNWFLEGMNQVPSDVGVGEEYGNKTIENWERWRQRSRSSREGMGVGISLGDLAGAVAKEGGIGIISAAQIGYREPDFDLDPKGANLRADPDRI